MSIFYFFDRLPSTNEWALQQQRPLPFFCVTYEQSAGHGRRTQRWHSHRGDCLLSYATTVDRVSSSISVLCGLRLAEFLTHLGIQVKLKWPNDLILFTDHNRPMKQTLSQSKIGGILIETKRQHQHNKIVIGVGINLSMHHDQQPYIAHHMASYQEIFSGVCSILSQIVQATTQPIHFKQWQRYDSLLNKDIIFDVDTPLARSAVIHQSNISSSDDHHYRYRMRAQGINTQGELIVYDRQQDYQTTINQAFNIRLAEK